MKPIRQWKTVLSLLLFFSILFSVTACAQRSDVNALQPQEQTEDLDLSRFLVAVEDEPDTVDFQCTTIHYTIAQNVFNRLVEMESNEAGEMEILPSLAESWEVSDDGRQYTFHLRKGVVFSNGADLKAAAKSYAKKNNGIVLMYGYQTDFGDAPTGWNGTDTSYLIQDYAQNVQILVDDPKDTYQYEFVEEPEDLKQLIRLWQNVW